MSVFVNNLDDFIAPSQACVNPLVADKLSASKGSGTAKISLESDFSTSEFDFTTKPDLIKSKGSSTVATVSLNDCLACSGCVTSAEAVLIEQQNYERLFNVLSEGEKCVIVTISPQTVASIAALLDVPRREAFLHLAQYLKSIGVKYVLDASAAGDIALIEAREEWENGRSVQWSAPTTTTAISSTRVQLGSGVQGTVVPIDTLRNNASLPMFDSHCPGWVCYAEKTQPQCIPYMSTTKSAQQICGALFKQVLYRDMQVTPTDIFHVSIQPCFDKKLEASRLDFYHESEGVHEVDLVLSTTELWHMVEFTASNQGDFDDNNLAMDVEGSAADAPSLTDTTSGARRYLSDLAPDNPTGRDPLEGMFRSFSLDGQTVVSAVDSNAGSGGLAEYLFRYMFQKLHGRCLASEQITYTQGRNADICEAVLDSPEGTSVPPIVFARVYGFRNIQSLMLKMKRGRANYDFVEVMACPSGCVNGGGQIKTKSSEHPKETSERVARTSSYFHNGLVTRSPDDSPLAQYVYSNSFGSDMHKHLFHTCYHAIPKLEVIAPLASKW